MNFDAKEREREPGTFHHEMHGTDILMQHHIIAKQFVQYKYHAGQLALQSGDSSLNIVYMHS